MAGTITGAKTRSRGTTKIAGTFTTDASGDASRTKIGSAWGRIVAVVYDPATGGVATGADITISDERGVALVTLTDAGTSARRFRPTAIPTTNAGVAVTPGAGYESAKDIFVAGDIYLTVAQGGATKTGTVDVIVAEATSVENN